MDLTATARPSVAMTRVQLALVVLMTALSVVSYFDRTIMSIAGPTVMKEFGISETAMGTVYSAFLFSYALLMTPGGRLADRFGPRLTLGTTGLGTALFTGLTALCGPPALGAWLGVLPALLIVRLAFGICAAPLYPACGTLTKNWIPARHCARVQAIIMAGAALGGALSPVVFAALIARYGWRVSFVFAAIGTALLFSVWLWYVRDYPKSTRQNFGKPASRAFPWRLLLADRDLVLLTLSYFCVNYFEYIFFYWIYFYFGQIRHLGARESAMSVSILMLTMVIMTPLGGWISDQLVAHYGRKRGRRLVPLLGMALSAVLLYAGASGAGVWATVVLLSLAFGSAASAEGPFWASAIDVGGPNAGAACGVMNTGGNIGGILAPILTPFISVRLGWTWGLYFGSLMVLLGVAAWFFIDPGRRRAG